MKKISLMAVLIATLPVAIPAQAADNSPACLAERASIERSISAAEARGNQRQLRGLRRALQASIANCSATSLAAARQEAIAEAQAEVTEREEDLAKAQRSSDPDKIAKRQVKLDEAKASLAEAQQPLPQ